MLQRLQKSMSEKDKGFTLIELLVVIVIIGILAGIAIPVFLNQRQKGADASVESDLKNAATAMETFFVDNQTYAGTNNEQLADSKKTEGNTIAITTADASGFCLTGTSDNTDNTFHYDSADGGMGDGAC